MSETTTPNTTLEIFKEEYKSLLRRCERDADKYTLKMNEDYEYFFRWYADKMYVAQLNLKAVRELRPMIYWDDTEKIKTWLENHISNIERTLIEGSQLPSSTSMMMNAAEVLKRVAMQELRQEYQRLQMVLTYNK